MDAALYVSQCLGKVLEMRGQDLFLKVGTVPRTRVGKTVIPMPFDIVNDDHTKTIVNTFLNPAQKSILEAHKSVDFAFSVAGRDRRFRANVFVQQGLYSVVVRTLWKGIPTFEELHLPLILKTIALERAGIILIGGVVSSGKTTTITAMLDMMNHNTERHIITVEDPVEYLHFDDKCIINQREIGQDANDFDSALKYVVRQSPDVIVIGEMRDADTLNFALNAAEVGRLVISTVHGRSVLQIFDRVLGFFKPEQRDTVLSQLYPNITCFAVQQLLVASDGVSLVPAFEIMIGNYTTRQLVKDKRFDKIPQALKNANREGMQTMDQALFQLWKDEVITKEMALSSSERPQELENLMKGIRIDGETGRILGG